MTVSERPVTFACAGETLLGMLHLPAAPASRGVLVVVGGPQYRVGSHRQFVLLARHLAEQGIPVMRFDYRGMGDSSGEAVDFEAIGPDIEAAVDTFFQHAPGLAEVAIWGLCDAASAALFYAHRDPRVSGLTLLNPWVRTEAGEAKAYLKHYYLGRLMNPNLWRKIVRGEFDFKGSLASLVQKLRSASGGGAPVPAKADEEAGEPSVEATGCGTAPLPERMLDGLSRFQGPVLLILSGDDLTAGEFRDVVGASRAWKRQLKDRRIRRLDLAEANHTFSRRDWRDQVAAATADWVKSW